MLKLVEQEVRIINGFSEPLATDTIVKAASVCYMKTPRGDASEFCLRLIERGHESPLEFVNLSFSAVTTRGVSHELVRHRMASYLQESQRFVDYSEGLPVILPTGCDDTAKQILCRAFSDAFIAYKDLREAGLPKQDARLVLPTATATHIRFNMNLRSFRNFLNLRTSPSAWTAMREFAHLCWLAATTFDPTLGPLLADVYHLPNPPREV